jgi:hypothetical protein
MSGERDMLAKGGDDGTQAGYPAGSRPTPSASAVSEAETIRRWRTLAERAVSTGDPMDWAEMVNAIDASDLLALVGRVEQLEKENESLKTALANWEALTDDLAMVIASTRAVMTSREPPALASAGEPAEPMEPEA